MQHPRTAGPLPDAATIVELLRRRAEDQPAQVAYRFLRDDFAQDGLAQDASADAVELTYAELDERARALAARLVQLGAAGERAILLYPSGLDYITAFFGCLYSGTVAVPAYPPNPARLASSLERLGAIVRDALPRVTLTTSAALDAITALTETYPEQALVRLVPTDSADEVPTALASAWRPPAVDADSTAFLQYTSGSTTQPRGVVLSHGNLLHNSGLIHRWFGNSPETRAVVWLPPYHDMGLIGGILQPLYGGFPVTLMAPTAFLQRPLRWLAAISRFRATASGGPNFAYDLCARKTTPEQRAALDLSEWRLAFNGAEPIRPETMQRFAAAFAVSGFRPEAFHPCYGLAEATLIVTGGVPWSPGAADAANRRVSCGRAADDQRVEIVNAVTRERCADGQEGEIWVAGPSVARSYWSRPELSAEVFQARLAGTGEGPFLRTGDLGFIRDGQLVVTGRLKDLIIVRGRNVYPQDVELTAERSHPALRPGCGAAFTAPYDGADAIVVAWEVAASAGTVDNAEVARALRTAVARGHEVQVHTVVLLPPGGIPKTSSGKVQRSLCAARYASGELSGQTFALPAGAARPGPRAGEEIRLQRWILLAAPAAQRRTLLEQYLRHRIADACGLDPDAVDPGLPLLALGADSVAVLGIGQAIEADLGIAVPLAAITDAASVTDLVTWLDNHVDTAGSTGPRQPASTAHTVTEASLSPAQRTLWFLQQLRPDSVEHNVAMGLRLRGRIDVAALRQALDALTDRHAALRTTFATRDGEPVARVAPTGTACLRVHEAGTTGGVGDAVNDAANESFDLAHGPLLRADLFAETPDEQVLLVVAHHIIIDFWSMCTLVEELETLYAFGPAPLAAPAAGYADVVAWQEHTRSGADGRAQQAYWAEELHGSVAELQLPHRESEIPTGSAARAGVRRLRIDPELTGRIKQRARTEGVTMHMLLLAAYQLLLHRYCGQEDLLVGVPMAGRGRPEFERVVGYCMNPGAIRSRLRPGESVRDVLAEVRRRTLGALAHQTFPLHHLESDRPAGAPLFQTLFVFNRPPVPGAAELALLAAGQPGVTRAFADLTAEPVEIELRESPVALHLSLAEIDDRLFATLRYRTDVFDAAGAGQLLKHYEQIVRAIADDAGQVASTVPMLDEAERRRILTDWAVAPVADAPGDTLAGLIERRAAATPDAVAVTGEVGSLTYRELNQRANRVAHLLAGRGIGVGARVGLYLDRSPDMIVALVAAVKSGAAYVPGDPSHPGERIAAMFAEAGVAVLLSQQALAQRLPVELDTIMVDDETMLAGQRQDNPDRPIPADWPIYVMYTSGSTGRPKGVMIGHRSLVNYVRFAAGHFGMSACDSVLQFASLSFDASIQQIFASLISGATLVLRNDRMLGSPRDFLDQCAQWSVTVLDLPTAYWHELVVGIAKAGATVPSTLRLVIIGGERAVADLVRVWQAQVGHRVRLINNYGPTEATIVAVTRDLTGYAGVGEMPIGRPVAGGEAYVLDGMRQPVPAGVVGELYLGGAGLAAGYLGRPELTAQAFVPHPFAAGSRLYRTGDLASFTADGELVFRGRADRQIKLRGYRVEPAEIESVLRELPEVADALVVLRESPRQLVGYIVGAGGAAPTPAELRTALRRRLPEYMVPSALVGLPAFPLNHNGKVDLAALPVPMTTAAEQEHTAPRTPVERFLADTFADVLALDTVSIDDDFFARGGQSLLATKVIARVREHLKVDLQLRELFEAPTPAGLAARLDGARAGGPDGLPVLEPVSRDQPLPLSFVQEGIWFLHLLAPDSAAYNVPRALRVRGRFDPEAVVEAFAALERRHEILRTTFPDDDGEPIQVIHAPRGIPVPIVDLQDAPESERDERIRQMIVEAGRAPFDLATGPLLRVTLVRFGPSDHVLIVIEHHLVHDGWAQGVFLRDFLELYQAQASGREPRLPELTVQFADYVYWQRRLLSGAYLDRLIDFWTREVAGAPQVLALPTDRPRQPALSFAGEQEVLVIEGEAGAALRRLSREHGATLFMTMFAAFATFLNAYSDQDDILIGVGVANRQRPEAEQLLGMMINTILVRADLAGDPSFGVLLDRVRERCLRAYAHQDLPFEKLVQSLRPKRSTARMPLCQVMFTFLDTPLPSLELPGLTLEPVSVHNKSAKFDLNVVVQPHAEQRTDTNGDEPDERITVLWEYNADIFEAATAHRMLEHFQTALLGAVRDAEQPLSALLPRVGDSAMPV